MSTEKFPSVEDRVVSSGVDLRSDLERHLHRVDVFKVSLWNAFGLNLRTLRHRVLGADGMPQAKPFQYLPELLPFLEPRVKVLGRTQRAAFETIKEHALESFWLLYADFLPLAAAVGKVAGIQQSSSGGVVDSDQLGASLARAIVLYESSRGTKFVTYLDKCLREAIKNIRGQQFAEQLSIPVSAGRMVHQITWMLQQAEFECRRKLSEAESDGLVIEFLSSGNAKFSEATMRQVATAIRQGRTPQSIERSRPWFDPSSDARRPDLAGNDCYLEESEERARQLCEIDQAIVRARFTKAERAVVLHRLDLPHDTRCLEQLSDQLTSATLRKRSTRLLLRLVAARYAPQAPCFGWLIDSTPAAARQPLRQAIEATVAGDVLGHPPPAQSYAAPSCAGQSPAGHSSDRSAGFHRFVADLLNWMAMSDSIFRVSISERGQIERYLVTESVPGKDANGSGAMIDSATMSKPRALSTLVFGKLKAALIEQERLGFPFRSG